jgi:hypothetical protein
MKKIATEGMPLPAPHWANTITLTYEAKPEHPLSKEPIPYLKILAFRPLMKLINDELGPDQLAHELMNPAP